MCLIEFAIKGNQSRIASGCMMQYNLKNHMNIDVDVHVLNLLILLMTDGGAMNHGFTAFLTAW